jgi:hypothetical protein
MNHIVIVLWVLLTTNTVLAAHTQIAPAPPPPQSARDALLEMFLGQGPDHLKRHLPEITKKAFAKIESGANPSFLTEVEGIAMQARAGGRSLQTMETGPVLLVSEQPQTREKFEVTVERDDLSGDEDEIDLSFQMSRNGKPEGLTFLPRLTFMMKMESGVWRLNEASFLARMPLADPDFLKELAGQIEEKQQRMNEFTASFSIRAIVSAETAYHTKHPGYTCSLSELAAPSPTESDERPKMPIDPDLAKGTKQGYVFALTGSDVLHYEIAAEPATRSAGHRAFCADESGVLKFSKNGKASTCLSSGQNLGEESDDVSAGFSVD